MNCPACHRETAVRTTFDVGIRVSRVRECECGGRFSTEETINRKSFHLIKGVPRGKVSAELRLRVMQRDGHRCVYCGSAGKLGLDHVVPLAAPVPDGVTRAEETARRNGFGNLVACCMRCNLTKGDKMLPVVTGNNQQAPPTSGNNPPLPIMAGGVGGGLSPIRSGSQSDPENTTPFLVASDPERVRVKPRRKPEPLYSAAFDTFWEMYPKRVGKVAAWGAWLKVGPDPERIATALEWQRKSQGWTKEEGMFIPHPATYLNQRRWEDEPVEVSAFSQLPPKVQQSRTVLTDWYHSKHAKENT